jgi:psp operon transcriptional activator
MAHIANPTPVTTPLGESPAFLAMLAHVSRLAPLRRPVLIVGERGTGKELIASRLAYLSPRWERPFVQLNCAALPESLLDSELFGHEMGAFTGAARRRAGRFELADTGTLFLDEIANASLAVQEKILRAIEYGTFTRLGGSATVAVDVRVIAATNADLPAMAAAGTFRADLLDRLAFDVIRLPPLRERQGDVRLLAEHFATRMTAELGRDYFPGFTPEARATLERYDWPGNVRELRNAVERSVARMEKWDEPLGEVVIDPFGSPAASPAQAGDRIDPMDTTAPEGPGNSDFRGKIRSYEVKLLREAMEAVRFNQRRAAERLGLSYDQLRHLLRQHPELRDDPGPEPAPFRPPRESAA